MDEDRRSHDCTHRRLLGSVPRPGSVGRRDLRVLGLRCPRSCRSSNVFSDSTCLACHAACRSFPLGSVADFECKGSSCRHDPARHGSFYLFAKTRGGEGERGGAKIIGYICVTLASKSERKAHHFPMEGIISVLLLVSIILEQSDGGGSTHRFSLYVGSPDADL